MACIFCDKPYIFFASLNSPGKFKYMACKMPKRDPYALLYIASSRLPGFYEPKVSESDAYAPAVKPWVETKIPRNVSVSRYYI